MANLFSSLDVLAEAALFCSQENQENSAQMINCPDQPIDYSVQSINCPVQAVSVPAQVNNSPPTFNPKKRKHYLMHLYEAEQRGLIAAQNGGLFDPSSSGYSPLSSSPEQLGSVLTPPASNPSSPTTEAAPVNPAIKPVANSPVSPAANSPVSPTVSPTASSMVSPAAGSTAKKSKSSRSKKASPKTPASSEAKSAAIKEYVKKVSITPKLEANSTKSLDTLREKVFDENVKIEVKTPKLTYTLRGMRTRKPSTKTPDHLKDEEYYAKRERNNEAARKSRNNKNAAIRTSELKLKQLEAERKQLDEDVGQEILIMKFLQMKMEADPALKERVMTLVEEKKLTSFNKVLNLKSEFSL